MLCYELCLLEGWFVAENASHQAHGKILIAALFHLFLPEGQLAFLSSVPFRSESFLLNVREVCQNVFKETISVGVAEPFDLKYRSTNQFNIIIQSLQKSQGRLNSNQVKFFVI